jgi:hypothetical protein
LLIPRHEIEWYTDASAKRTLHLAGLPNTLAREKGLGVSTFGFIIPFIENMSSRGGSMPQRGLDLRQGIVSVMMTHFFTGRVSSIIDINTILELFDFATSSSDG